MWKSKVKYVENECQLWKSNSICDLKKQVFLLPMARSPWGYVFFPCGFVYYFLALLPRFSMTSLTLNLSQGSVSFRFSLDAATVLQQDLNQLVQRLKAIAIQVNQKERPQKQASLEYRSTGDVFLEVFCNPNLYASPYAAKVLLTIRDERIRLTTEAELNQLVTDLEEYLAQAS